MIRVLWCPNALIILLLALAFSPAAASEGPPPVLEPKIYSSPSGDFSLEVDPSDMNGRYGATYRVTKNGTKLWSGKLPFTIWEAGITDAGVVGGYAYTHGWRGFGRGGFDEGWGNFLVVIIDANGKIRLKKVTKRKSSRFLHTPPNPLAGGLIVDAPNDRMIVRVSDPDLNRRVESWWVYRLSTGAALGKLEPKKLMPDPNPARFVIDAKPVAGTPLILVHWWRYERDSLGARFTLIDLKGKPAWLLELKGDYNVPGDEQAQDKLMDIIKRRGAILRSDLIGRFDLHFAAESKRVTFSVKRGPSGGWTVSEVARAPYSISSTKPKPPMILERPLKSLGTLVLQAKQKQPPLPIRGVRDFVFDGRGRIAFLRREENRPGSFVLLDQTGKILREIRLRIEDKPDTYWTGYTWVGGNRFIITRSVIALEGKAEAWWVDVETGKVNAIAGFDCPSIDRIVGFPDGSFVALATKVCGFDARGKRTWTLREDYRQFPETLLSPEDVAVTTTGKVAVIDVIKKAIQVFDRRGKYLRVIDLKKAWGREPSYPSGIAPDADGGFLVNDFGGSPPFVRMKRDGAVRTGFQPKYPDGRTFDTPDDVKIAPDGRLWTCDGHAILRLNDSGVVDRVLGQPPQAAQLGDLAALTIDRRGLIYAVARRTGAVHVFNPDGKFLHVCKPKPTDFPGELWSTTHIITDQGHVYLSMGGVASRRRGEYLHFSADGKRLGTKRMKTEKWYFQPGTGNGLALGYEEAYLVNPDGQTIRTIKRRPDGNWLERPHHASMAPDGSFAIVAHKASWRDPTQVTVNLYKAGGEPIRTVTMPTSLGRWPNIAYNGHRLVAAGSGYLVIFDSSGSPLQSFRSASKGAEDAAGWCPYLVADGRQLLLSVGKSTTLHRYAMP